MFARRLPSLLLKIVWLITAVGRRCALRTKLSLLTLFNKTCYERAQVTQLYEKIEFPEVESRSFIVRRSIKVPEQLQWRAVQRRFTGAPDGGRTQILGLSSVYVMNIEQALRLRV